MKKQRSQLGTDLAYVWLLIQLEIPICKLAFKRRFSFLHIFAWNIREFSYPCEWNIPYPLDEKIRRIWAENPPVIKHYAYLAASGRSPKPHWNAGRFGGMDWNAQNVFRAWKTIQSMMYDIYIYI